MRLADGIRSSALAAWLFGRAGEVPPVPAPPPFRGAALPWRSFRAARAHRQMVRDTDAGLVPPQADSRPALHSNARPDGVRSVRTVIRKRAELPGPTVTAGGAGRRCPRALAGHLRELGDDPSALGAEVPMAKAGVRQTHNHFGNVGVGLYPEFIAISVHAAESAIGDVDAYVERLESALGPARGNWHARCHGRHQARRPHPRHVAAAATVGPTLAQNSSSAASPCTPRRCGFTTCPSRKVPRRSGRSACATSRTISSRSSKLLTLRR